MDARRRRMRWVKGKRRRDECVRKLLERSGARAYRHGAAAARRVQRQQEHARPPPQHARKTTFPLSVLLFNMLRRRGFAKDAGFRRHVRGRAKVTVFIEKKGCPEGRGSKRERGTNGDRKVPGNARGNTVSELIAGVRATRGI